MRATIEIHVSPATGNDRYNGFLPEPDAGRTDGPVASLKRARHMARELRQRGLVTGEIRIWLHGGTYPITFPLEFGPDDPGPCVYAAWPGETPVIDGGVRIPSDAWHAGTRHSVTVWKADVRGILAKHGPFRSIFVNGCRRPRARWPHEGYLRIAGAPDMEPKYRLFDGQSRFVMAPGDLDGIGDLHGAELVIAHKWIEERLPVESYDSAARLLVTTARSCFTVWPEKEGLGNTCYLDNCPERLGAPGEWYLDADAAELLYVPAAGERMEDAEVVVPVVLQHLRIMGDPVGGRTVSGLRFEGITFRHGDWCPPSTRPVWWDPYRPAHQWRTRDSFRHFLRNDGINPHLDYGNVPQGAFHLPGAIQLEAAVDCAVTDCLIEHVGFYGIGLGEGCRRNHLVGNTIRDMGAGGVVADGGDTDAPAGRQTGDNHITDNRIHSGGWVFPSSDGIISVYAGRMRIAHNEVYDMCCTGISVGWVWDYRPSPTRENRVEKNHVHHLGQRGSLSDMGGIYLLGFQPGTFVIGNVVHDIEMATYGGDGIYPDQGSSCMVFENNIVYRAADRALHEHWGRQNVYRNNIFAFGREACVCFSRERNNLWVDYPAPGCLFERNILLSDGAPCHQDQQHYFEWDCRLTADLNLFWDLSRPEPRVRVYEPWGCKEEEKRVISFAEHQVQGFDRHALAADPMFADPRHGDFTLAPDSPALRLGFIPIDTRDVGPRPRKGI